MKDIYIGLDLCKKHLQLSFFREDKQEPESIYQLNNSETYQLPNVMFYALEERKWYVGNNVGNVRFRQEGVMIEDIIDNIDSMNHVIVDGASYTYETLLLILLKTHVNDFIARSQEYCLAGITVTLDTYHPVVYKTLLKLREELGVRDEAFHVMSHENAFYQYVMRQDEKIRTNSVAMFEYGTDGMDYYRIDKKYQGKTRIYSLSHQDMKGEMTYQMLFQDVEKLDKHFAELARVKMKETYISTVYLTGPGFNEQWIQEATKVLCDGRRVFMGQNIYTKGACYHAKFGAYEENKDCVFVAGGSIPFDIGVSIGEVNGRESFYPIALGGREWYNMKGKITLFMDDTNRVEMIYRDKISKDILKEIIEIHGLPKRPPKTTKLSLEVELYDEKMGAIIIRDEGFGKIFPTTNKIYRKDFSIG